MWKTVIAGTRVYDDAYYPVISQILDSIFSNYGTPMFIVSGMARGPDLMGKRYAEEHGIAVIPMPAEWDKHGRSAGHIRNREMAVEGDSLIAFWDGKSSGTRSMIQYAKEQKHNFIAVINLETMEIEIHD